MQVRIEQDAAYRRDGDRYVEVCRACARDRAAATCPCGAGFERLERKFLTVSWKPARIALRMPDECPHCGGKPDRVRSITIRQPTGLTSFGYTLTRMTIETPSCRRMLPPALAWLLVVTSAFWCVVFGLAALFGHVPALALLAASLAALYASWRAYGWIRFAGFDHRSLRFRVRRPAYARALADANRGRAG